MRRTWLAAEDRRRLSVHGKSQHAAEAGSLAEHGRDGDAAQKMGSTPGVKQGSRPPSPNTPLDNQDSSQTTSGQSRSQASPGTSQEVDSFPQQQQQPTPPFAPPKAPPGRSKLSPFNSASQSISSVAPAGKRPLTALDTTPLHCMQHYSPEWSPSSVVHFMPLTAATLLGTETWNMHCRAGAAAAAPSVGWGSVRSSASSGSRQARSAHSAEDAARHRGVVPGTPLISDSQSGSEGAAELPGEAWQGSHAHRQVRQAIYNF